MTKISKEDYLFLKAYVKWCITKGFPPTEYEFCKFTDNMNMEYRYLVEDLIEKLEKKGSAVHEN